MVLCLSKRVEVADVPDDAWPHVTVTSPGNGDPIAVNPVPCNQL